VTTFKATIEAEDYEVKCRERFPHANALGCGLKVNLEQDIVFLPEDESTSYNSTS
jgi:hypothetical protein